METEKKANGLLLHTFVALHIYIHNKMNLWVQTNALTSISTNGNRSGSDGTHTKTLLSQNDFAFPVKYLSTNSLPIPISRMISPWPSSSCARVRLIRVSNSSVLGLTYCSYGRVKYKKGTVSMHNTKKYSNH